MSQFVGRIFSVLGPILIVSLANAEAEEALVTMRRALNQRQYLEAERLAQTILSGAPENGEARWTLAMSFLGRNQLGSAESEINRLLDLDPLNGAGFFALGLVRGKQARYAEAEAAFRKAIEAGMSRASTYHNLGLVLLKQGKRDDGFRALEQAIERGPENAAIIEELATKLASDNRLEKALEVWRLGQQRHPQNALFFGKEAEILTKLGKLDTALARCEIALQLAPDRGESHAIKGRILLQQGETDAARQAFLRALEIDPNLLYPRLKIGQILMREGKREEGSQHLETYRRLKEGATELETLEFTVAARPGSFEIQMALADEYRLRGRFEEAMEHYEMGLDLQPDDADANYRVGMGYFYFRRHQESLPLLASAFEKKPELPDLGLTLAQLTAAAGQLAKADEIAHKTIGLAPGNPLAWEIQGEIKFALGVRKAALESLRKAVQLLEEKGADSQRLRRRIAEIETN